MTGLAGLPSFNQVLRNIPLHTKEATSPKMVSPASFGVSMVGLVGISTISLAYKCGYVQALRAAPSQDTQDNTNSRESTVEDVVLPRPPPAEESGALKWPRNAVRQPPEHQNSAAGQEAKQEAIARHTMDISEIKAKEQRKGPRPSDFFVMGA